MPAVMFLEERRLLIVDLYDWPDHRSETALLEEIANWLGHHRDLLQDRIKKETPMISMDLPEESVEEIGYLIQGLTDSELPESELIKQLEYHTTETIESVGRDSLQKARAGGKLLRSVLSYLIKQNFSPLGCLILVHQDKEKML
jgi:hypothetical protein